MANIPQNFGYIKTKERALVDLNSKTSDELRILLKKEQDILNSPVSKKLPDKGEKIRKKIIEIQELLNQRELNIKPDIPLEDVISVASMKIDDTDLPQDVAETSPSNPSNSDDMELDGLERKLN